MLRRLSLALALALVLVVALPLAALAAAPLPHLFYGTVQTSTGGPLFDAPPGTVVTAWVGGEQVGDWTVTVPGLYGDPPWFHLIVQDDPPIVDGSLILFYIDGQQADQTYDYQSGNVTELNLTVTFSTPTPTATATASATPSSTPTASASATATASPTTTASATATPTASPTATPTPTATIIGGGGGGGGGRPPGGGAVPTLTAGPTGGPTAEPTDGPTDTKKPESTPTPTTTPDDDAGGTGFSGGDWAALGAGLWFLLLLLCLLALWWFKWRKGKLPDEGEPEETL